MSEQDRSSSSDAVARQIGATSAGRRRFFTPRGGFALAAVLVVIAAVWFWSRAPSEPALRYQTEVVARGDLVVRVSATGNLEPTTQVDVGSELSGIIEAVLVNDNDHVHKGQVLARLDTSKLRDQVVKSEAALESARASVALNRAATKEARGNLERMQEAWRLSGGQVPSKADLSNAETALDKAIANDAAARASVGQAAATLRSDRTSLEKALIRSPIDGVVLLRKVEPGQTVAASLQAPVLFTLAQSLTQMELQVDIDEADVGQVRDGQAAEFTVDAYADRTYPARITRVRYGSETTNGVVTYQGVLQVGNEDLSLRPGMTASASIVTLTRKDVLRVPNAALRFAPPTAGEQGGEQAGGSGSVTGVLLPRPPSGNTAKSVTVVARGSEQTVWLLRAGGPVGVPITVGATDGRHTEVLSGELKHGDAVIIDSIGQAR